jgi:hypothetical protein
MKDLTQIQRFALEMLLRALGEDQCFKSFEDSARIFELIPKALKQVHYLVNDELGRYSLTDEFKGREFCRFKAGDKIIRYEKYPTSISRETIRQALVNSGWWLPCEEPDWLKLLISRSC